jgi:rRNA-processing protein EBP2
VQTKLKREQNKKEDLNAIKNWRKMQKNVDTRQEEFPEALLQEGSKVRRDIAEKVNNRSGPSKKRKAKDQKYGYGGVKRGKKGNTADSAMDTSQWSAKQNKRLSPGLAKV